MWMLPSYPAQAQASGSLTKPCRVLLGSRRVRGLSHGTMQHRTQRWHVHGSCLLSPLSSNIRSVLIGSLRTILGSSPRVRHHLRLYGYLTWGCLSRVGKGEGEFIFLFFNFPGFSGWGSRSSCLFICFGLQPPYNNKHRNRSSSLVACPHTASTVSSKTKSGDRHFCDSVVSRGSDSFYDSFVFLPWIDLGYLPLVASPAKGQTASLPVWIWCGLARPITLVASHAHPKPKGPWLSPNNPSIYATPAAKGNTSK